MTAGVERGTFSPASPAPDVRAHARPPSTGMTYEQALAAAPAAVRAATRARRSELNRAAHAARQAARDLRRAAAALPEDNPHRAGLLASAEHNAHLADTYEAALPTVPSKRQPQAPRTLTAADCALLKSGGIDVGQMLAAGAYARADAAAHRRRR